MPDIRTASPNTRRKERPSWVAVLGVLLIGLTILVYVPAVSAALGPLWVLLIYDGSVLCASIVAAALAARLWRSFERGEMLRLIWGHTAVGLILWVGGEMIWSSDQLWGGDSLPYPSMADVLWLLGYLPLTLAFGLRVFSLKILPNKPWQFAILGVYLVISILTVWLIILPIFADTDTTRLFEKTVNLLYPLGDLVIGFITVHLLLVLVGGMLFRSWGMISLGFLCGATSDLLYAWAVWREAFESNPAAGDDMVSFVINLLYVAFYVFVAIGLHRETRLVHAL
jgi:hypothetical protein